MNHSLGTKAWPIQLKWRNRKTDSRDTGKWKIWYKQAVLTRKHPLPLTCSLVVSTLYNPIQVLEKLTPLLTPSAKICIHDPRKDPLMECYKHIRSSPLFCNTALTESWMRGYQGTFYKCVDCVSSSCACERNTSGYDDEWEWGIPCICHSCHERGMRAIGQAKNEGHQNGKEAAQINTDSHWKINGSLLTFYVTTKKRIYSEFRFQTVQNIDFVSCKFMQTSYFFGYETPEVFSLEIGDRIWQVS